MSTQRSLDMVLIEVSKRFISINDAEMKKSQVFQIVFDQIKQKMGEQCNFFQTYSSQVVYGGSVADGIKISKMDEFDIDIVIRLPISNNDGPDGIIIENDQAGYVKLKIINAFDNLDKQQNWESRHKVVRDWRDSEKYFLQNKFRQWLHGIVQKTINEMDCRVEVNGVTYLLTYKESGPAYTLKIRNEIADDDFTLDVDLVPVIKFTSPRWPTDYTTIPESKAKDWFVVPKPNKSIPDGSHKNQCWRLSFQEHEREMIKDCQHLKSVIKLVKKLRDTFRMKAIASYYIKTLFLWKVFKNDKKYWQNKLSFIFRDMVKEFYEALNKKEIPYFWQPEFNLIESLKESLIEKYAKDLKLVLNYIDEDNVENVTKALLTPDEIREFENCDFYRRFLSKVSIDSGIEFNSTGEIAVLKGVIDSYRRETDDVNLKMLEARVDDLADRVAAIEDRLKLIEINSMSNLRAADTSK